MFHPTFFLSLIVLSAFASAQQSVVISSPETKPNAPSLADLARQARQNKPATKAKTVVTDETLNSRRTLFPAIHPELDNSEEIVREMVAYSRTHTPKETEDAIREWYEIYDQKMANAIHEQKDIQDRQLQRSMSEQDMYEYGGEDYRKYQALRRAENRTAVSDQQAMRTNGLLTAKIQQTFQMVRGGLQKNNIRYEWFKIRFGNGNGSW